MKRIATTTAAGLLTGATMLAALTTLTACSSDQSGSAVPATSAATAKPASKTKPTPTSTVATLPAAANATDLASCASGSCEVEVTGPVSIPTAPAFGVTTIAVTAIGTDTVSVEVTMPAGQMSFDCTDPNCNSELTGPAAGGTVTTADASPHAGATYTADHLGLRVVAIVGGAAVLRLAPA